MAWQYQCTARDLLSRASHAWARSRHIAADTLVLAACDMASCIGYGDTTQQRQRNCILVCAKRCTRRMYQALPVWSCPRLTSAEPGSSASTSPSRFRHSSHSQHSAKHLAARYLNRASSSKRPSLRSSRSALRYCLVTYSACAKRNTSAGSLPPRLTSLSAKNAAELYKCFDRQS